MLHSGFLHIMLVLIGRAHVFWDFEEDDDDFLPDWGRPGQLGGGLIEYPTDATRDVLPVACHSHNDYWRRVPLFDAIHWGCTSVEADVWLFDDDLFVGHSTSALSRERTMRSLYVDPLVELLQAMNPQTDFANTTRNGVFDVDPDQTLVFVVDIKTEPATTFEMLQRQLEPLREKDYLTYFDGREMHRRAITVVGTGNTPFDLVVSPSRTRRDIFFDAPLELLWEAPASSNVTSPSLVNSSTGSKANTKTAPRSGQGHTGFDDAVDSPDLFDATNSYYASTSFGDAVGFAWRGGLSPQQLEIIRGQIRGARQKGLKVRYWDTPSWPVSTRNHVWRVLSDEGVDVLSVDDVKGAAVEDWRRRVHRWWS